MSDENEERVRQAIIAVRGGPSEAAVAALADLASMDEDELLLELFMELDEAYAHADLDRLRASALVGDPATVLAIADAVTTQDVTAIKAQANGDYSDLVTALIGAIIALQDTAS